MDMANLENMTVFCIIHDIIRRGIAENTYWEESVMPSRIIDVIAYVSEHYGSNLRLEDVAALFYVSPATLSRGFKKETGRTFSQYVADLKSAGAASDLIRTDLPIARITERNGYSSPSQFTQSFKQRYGVTPREYRRSHSITRSQRPTRHTVAVDAQAPGRARRIRLALNVGDMLALELRSFREQLERMQASIGASAIRLTNIYAPELLNRDDFGRLELNFDRIDNIFDYLAERRLSLIVELSSRTQWVHKDLFESLRSATDAFTSPEEADRILRRFLVHLRDRYGPRTLRRWRFELRYNHDMASETPARHAEVFAKAWFAAKQICPDIRFGGSGVMLATNRSLLPSIVTECQRLSVTPDFLSFHSYVNPTALRRMDALSDDIDFAERTMPRRDSRIPVVVSEWNLSISERNAFNDTVEKGAAIMQVLAVNLTRDIEVSYSAFSDLNAHYYDATGLFCGGNGIVSKDGFRKPSFYALSALSNFPGTIIGAGPHYVVGRDEYGGYLVLAFNPTGMNADYFSMKEYEVTRTNIHRLYNPGRTLTLTFSMSNLEHARYLVRTYMVDDTHGNSVAAAERIAVNGEIRPEDLAYVDADSMPGLSSGLAVAQGGAIAFDVTLSPHAFAMVRVTPQ